jgi:hypothetical protein
MARRELKLSVKTVDELEEIVAADVDELEGLVDEPEWFVGS